MPNSGYNTLPSSSANSNTGYSILGNSAIDNSYSLLPDTNYRIYLLPSVYGAYSNLGSSLNTYISNGSSGLETSYLLPATYGNYPTIYGSHDSEKSRNSLSNSHSLFNYQRNRKAVAADDAP